MNKKVLTFVLVLSMAFGMIPLAGQTGYAAEGLGVQVSSSTTNETINQIDFKVRLTNNGASSIALSDIRIRYYYTIDGARPQNFWCNWASCGTDVVNGSFHSISLPISDADHYFELSFDSGTVAPGENVEVHIRFAKDDWSNYIQSNDYSYTNSLAFQEWTKVTVYVGGARVWGVHPGTPPVISSISPSGNDISPATNTLILSFEETVTASSPEIRIFDGTDAFTSNAIVATVSGTGTSCKAQIPFTAFSHDGDALLLDHDTTYTVTIEEGAFEDGSGAPIASGTVGTFTTKENLEGGGTEQDPYRIETLEDLQNISALDLRAGCCYRLMNDIPDPVTAPLGVIGSLKGTFDGGGHTIAADIEGAGLFAEIGTGGMVKNLNITGTVTGSGRAGGLAGSSAGTVLNCYADVEVTGVAKAGGLVGENYNGQIIGSGAAGNVICSETAENARVYSGGLAGLNNNGTIKNSYAKGNVTGSSIGNNSSTACVGGFVGENEGEIANCYASGSVNGTSESNDFPVTALVGGLVGDNYNNGTIINCYSAGYATGAAVGSSPKVGGLAGYNYDTVEHSYYNDTLNSLSVGAGSSDGIAGISSFGSDMEGFSDQLSDFGSMAGTGYAFEISAGENNGYPVIVSHIPSVSISSDRIRRGESGSFTVGFGNGAATGAYVVSEDTSIVSVDMAHVTSEAVEVNYTGNGIGSADITVTFNDMAETVQTLSVTVTRSGSSGNHHRNDSNQNGQETDEQDAQDDTNSGTGMSYGDIRNHWAKNAIDFAVGKGLFQGTGNGVFSPDKPMSRGMLVTVLGRLFEADHGQPVTESGQNFGDVNSGMYYARYIAWATQNGIASGIGADRFMPNSPITREQLVLMLYSFAQLDGQVVSTAGSGTAGYADSGQISAWAEEAMNWAVNTGILSGDNNGELNPRGEATRAEVAIILQRFIER